MQQTRQDLIMAWFDGSLGAEGPEGVLRAQGFRVARRLVIYKPTPAHTMTFEQFQLVAFLVQERDYGFDPYGSWVETGVVGDIS